MTMPNGCVLYEGPSMLNGADIVVIVTGLVRSSLNAKTDDMLQVWIVDATEEPHLAAQTGGDESVCGDCPARPGAGGFCYLVLHQAVLSVYRGWKRGIYPTFDRKAHGNLIRGRTLRMGAYGDPAAVPLHVWARFTRYCPDWTGYSHQWRRPEFAGLAKYCMASVETAADAELARSMGWRTFRNRLPNEGLLPWEFECPASAEQGHRLTCAECGACDGGAPPKASATIIRHGPRSKVNKYDAWRAAATCC